MPQTTDDIRVGANSHLFVAPVGTAEPATIAAAMPAGWVDIGYTDENGFKVTDTKTVTPIPVAQLFYAARRIISARDFSLDFVLRQFDAESVKLGFGGGAITLDGAGEYRYTPPSPEFIDERAMCAEFLDGAFTYRFIIPRGLVTNNVVSEFTRTKAADLPITFSLIGQDNVEPWLILTDDGSFADLVGS